MLILTIAEKNGSALNANQENETAIVVKNDKDGALRLFGYTFVFDESVSRIGLTMARVKVASTKEYLTSEATPIAAIGIAAMPTAPGLRICVPLGDRRNPGSLPVIAKGGDIPIRLLSPVAVPAGSIYCVFFGTPA